MRRGMWADCWPRMYRNVQSIWLWKRTSGQESRFALRQRKARDGCTVPGPKPSSPERCMIPPPAGCICALPPLTDNTVQGCRLHLSSMAS
eukprot:2085324-Lingulodinium_polyedra.AAC.1